MRAITDDPGRDRFGFTWDQARDHVKQHGLTESEAAEFTEQVAFRLLLEPYQIVQMTAEDIDRFRTTGK